MKLDLRRFLVRLVAKPQIMLLHSRQVIAARAKPTEEIRLSSNGEYFVRAGRAI